jgi:hypothetical protein
MPAHIEAVTLTDRNLSLLIRGEYLGIPGLHLTRDQVQHLWGLERHTCDRLLASLVGSRFLDCNRADEYVRAGS